MTYINEQLLVELTQLDELAKLAMVALIAKADFTIGGRQGVLTSNQYTAIANGSYEYAKAMMETRQQFHEQVSATIVQQNPALEKPLYILHGVTVYPDTIIETRDNCIGCGEDEWYGEFTINDADDMVCDEPILELLTSDPSWEPYYRVKQ